MKYLRRTKFTDRSNVRTYIGNVNEYRFDIALPFSRTEKQVLYHLICIGLSKSIIFKRFEVRFTDICEKAGAVGYEEKLIKKFKEYQLVNWSFKNRYAEINYKLLKHYLR